MKEWARRVMDLPARRRRLGELAEWSCAGTEYPVLGFGGVLEPGGLVHGGAVKLLSLREVFPSDERRFNILYAVSSAQPAFLPDLARNCWRRGIRVVWNQNGVAYPAWAGAEAERWNRRMRKIRAEADYVIYQSEFCRDSADRFLGPCDAPTRTLLNPVDLEVFVPSPDFRPPRPLRMLAMGTQATPGRVRAALEATSELRRGGIDATLSIAGRCIWSGAAGQIDRWVGEWDLRGAVTLHGAFSREAAPSILRGHHLLLHPKYMDPCPTVVAEALASGLPVVGSASGGLPEMVDERCARLIPAPEDFDRQHEPSGPALAEGVRDLLPRLDSARRAAREVAEARFDQTVWVAAHADIFREVMTDA